MKKIILLITASFIVQFGNAQKTVFGLKAGLNYSNLTSSEDFNFKANTSYHFGALLEFNFVPVFSIQPEVMYSVQGATSKDFQDVELDYVTIPVVAKIYFVPDIFALELGPQYAFLVNDDFGNTIDNKTYDFSAVGGFSVYLGKHIFGQARYVLGLTDTTKNAEIKNRTFQLSLGYSF
jgi:hypothetical protein